MDPLSHRPDQSKFCPVTYRSAWLFAVIFLLVYQSNASAGLRAGAAKTCITPRLGIQINGGLGPSVARYIHDDLWVRALVLDDGTNRIAFGVVDTCLLDQPVFDAAKRLIQQHTSLKPEQIMLSCTHTHSAGSACGAHLTDADPEYRAWLPIQICDAIRGALSNAAPAQIAWGRGSLPQHVFCRRILLKPGTVYTNQLGLTQDRAKMNWDSPHPADGEPAGPTDPEVSVLSVRYADGRPLAILANYSLHYVGDVGPGHISADYFGVFADRIQQLLGADRQDPPFVGILCNGTSGDINNINPKSPAKSPSPYTRIRAVAEDAAQEVLRVLSRMNYQSDVALHYSLKECPVVTRRPDPIQLQAAQKLLGGRSADQLKTWQENQARELVFLSQWPEKVALPLQVFQIGTLAVAGWPGEIFAVSGLELKSRSPTKPLFNIGLANGWYGYIPPPEQFQLGAYETWTMRTSPLATNAIPEMLATFESMLREIQKL